MNSTKSSFQATINKGDRLHGYVVEWLLGRGGLGAVYLVRHEIPDTPFAL